MGKEKWTTVPKFPMYKVSSMGRVYSINRKKIMKPFERWHISGGKRQKKAVTIVLVNRKKPTTFHLHYLVLSSFCPNNNKNLTVDHIDRDRFNNSLSNLRWATIKQQSDNRRSYRGHINKISTQELEKIYQRTKTELLGTIAKDYPPITKSDLCKILRYIHPEY